MLYAHMLFNVCVVWTIGSRYKIGKARERERGRLRKREIKRDRE